MRLIFILFTLFILSHIEAQNLIWNEDFQGALDWDLTLEPGFNDPTDANVWVISDDEGGVAPPNCGVAANGNNTLHVSCQGAWCVGTGALYNAGDGGAGFFNSTTDRRAAYTQAISTVGETNLEFRFDWIGVGQAGQDFAELEYSIDGGTTWVVLWTQTPGAICGGGQGEWAEEIVALPAALENQADLRFAYRWRNDNDGAGSDPSFAINNLRLFADAGSAPPPNADFTVVSTTICEGDCITFTDNSTGSNINSWDWSFDGGATPNTSTDQNPSNICFNTAGSYDVSLTVTDDNGTNTTTTTIQVDACGVPNAEFTMSSNNICETDCISLTDNSTGSNISSWDWDFGGGAVPNTSTDQNPTNICFDTEGTYTITLTITDDNGTDSNSQTISVNDCTSGPTASFSISDNNPCAGDCISFVDNSTGSNVSGWGWDFGGGGTPNNSTDQNPTNICFDTPGTYTITLGVTDDNGNDTFTQTITVDDCSSPGDFPNANFTYEGDLCEGNCLDFEDLSTGEPTSWSWNFDGGSPNTSSAQNPSNICFDSAGVYNVNLTVENENGQNTFTFPLNFTPAPTIEAFGDTLIEVGGVAELEAVPTGFGSVIWTPSEDLDCDDCLEVEATPLISTVFTVTVTDANGCQGSDQVNVLVNFEEIIGVPSAFSPNNDGLNDILYVKGVGITTMDFRVYNRYGQQIFRSTDQAEGWDGTFEGERLNQGVFAYTLTYTLVNGQSGELSGNITLVK